MIIETKKYYGFIYITTNNINGKRYIGQKKFDKSNGSKWINYLGSGVVLQQAIKKYGEENFSRVIVCFCKTKKDLDDQEIKTIKLLNAKNDSNFYNIALGGEGGNGTHQSKPIYCIDLKTAFYNSFVASEYTGENRNTIRNKAKKYGKQTIRDEYNYCYFDNIYKFFPVRCGYQAVPVVELETGKVYGSFENARKITKIPYNRRNVISIEQYNKLIDSNKVFHKKLLKLTDYLIYINKIKHI